MADVDFTPGPQSFLGAVAHAHPNTAVRVGNVRDTAGNVTRDVQQMLAEIAELRAERSRWQGIALKLSSASAQPIRQED